GKISREEYREAVNGAVAFLKKGSDETVKSLTAEMEQAAEELQFEKAAKLRDKITAIGKLGEKQKVVMSPYESQDIIAFVKGERHACFEVFVFRKNRLADREHFFVDYLAGEDEARAQFIVGYYSMRSDIPPRIVVDGEVEDEENVTRFLREKRQKNVVITTAQRGEQRRLLEMCRQNAAERIAQKEGARLRDTAVLDELRSLLGLKRTPEYIEAYDISNTMGENNVAGMIVFRGAKPYKKAYKRFAIKSFEGQDDYRSMHEVLSRRMQEYELHKGDDAAEGFGKMPDLILLDGGEGQLAAVMPILEQYGMQDRVFGMVKDDHHRTRALVGKDGEIAIKPTRPVFRLITLIQDEVHRFAIGYHRKKSEKDSLNMQLTAIEGIGKTRAAALLKSFKNINDIATASVEELSAVRGMNKSCAQKIYDYYH
ncbi:MAG: excinuclease ABC subunit UvrC, partial [Acutalibacteraceae bacterium]